MGSFGVAGGRRADLFARKIGRAIELSRKTCAILHSDVSEIDYKITRVSVDIFLKGRVFREGRRIASLKFTSDESICDDNRPTFLARWR